MSKTETAVTPRNQMPQRLQRSHWKRPNHPRACVNFVTSHTKVNRMKRGNGGWVTKATDAVEGKGAPGGRVCADLVEDCGFRWFRVSDLVLSVEGFGFWG